MHQAEHKKNENVPIEVIVGAYIINDDHQVLLFQSPKWENNWTLSGGHIEAGETIERATAREIKEETGLTVQIQDIFNFGERIVKPPVFKREAHFIFIDSIACIIGGDLKLDMRELTAAKWFDIDEAVKLPNITPSCQKGLFKLKKRLTINSCQTDS